MVGIDRGSAGARQKALEKQYNSLYVERREYRRAVNLTELNFYISETH